MLLSNRNKLMIVAFVAVASHLNIFTTNIPTDYRVPTLMHDHIYRMGVAWQNVGYNQPPHLLAGTSMPLSAAERDTIRIDKGWTFHRGDISDVSQLKSAMQTQGEMVNLPHDFQISQDWVAPDASERPDNSDVGSNVRSRLSPRGFKEMGIGWYRYELTPKDEWKGKRIVLDFQGIMLVGDVYLNGQRIGGTDYGYLGFDIDISKLLKYGQVNEIAVKADTRNPNNSRWYTGAGLYRDVNLIVTDSKLYFPRHPLFIRTVNNQEVNIRAEIVNWQKIDKAASAAIGKDAHHSVIPVEVRILDAEGKVVAQQKTELDFNAQWLTQYAGGKVDWGSLWQKDIPEWVTRDRNHPSVVLWSLGNELQQYSNLPFNDWGVTAYKLQKELLRRYDDTRLTTVAMHPRYRNLETKDIPADLAVATEVNSYNYRYMYFSGDMKRYPEKTFYQSEASTAAMGPNFYEMDRDKVIGLAYWGAIDYLGESMGWPVKGWNQGVFDISLQPKPDASKVELMVTNGKVKKTIKLETRK